MATGGLPGLVRAAATQTSDRSVLSGVMPSQSSWPTTAIALACPGPSTWPATRAASPGGPPRRTVPGMPGLAEVRRDCPSGISRIRIACALKIRAAPVAAADASPSKVSAALMFRVTLASSVSMAAVRSARCLARKYRRAAVTVASSSAGSVGSIR